MSEKTNILIERLNDVVWQSGRVPTPKEKEMIVGIKDELRAEIARMEKVTEAAIALEKGHLEEDYDKLMDAVRAYREKEGKI